MSKVSKKDKNIITTKNFGKIFENDEDYTIELVMDKTNHTLILTQGSKQICKESYTSSLEGIILEIIPLVYFKFMDKCENVVGKNILVEPVSKLYLTILYLFKTFLIEDISNDLTLYDDPRVKKFVDMFTEDSDIETYGETFSKAWKLFREKIVE